MTTGHDLTTSIVFVLIIFLSDITLHTEDSRGVIAVSSINSQIDVHRGDVMTTMIVTDFPLPTTTFRTSNSTVVVSQTGSTALIPCIVENIGDSTVSWIRRKVVQQLLTVGSTTYSSDERFQAVHLQHSADWSLQIKYVQRRDAGVYECQVSTHPPSSIFLELEVVDAQTEIDGPAEKFLRPDSTLLLRCVVKKSTEIPAYLFWYHNSRMVNYDTRNGFNVSTDLLEKESWLRVPRATVRHSGNYSCAASNARPSKVVIHIFNGDNPAAMQHSSASSSLLSLLLCRLYLATLALSLLRHLTLNAVFIKPPKLFSTFCSHTYYVASTGCTVLHSPHRYD